MHNLTFLWVYFEYMFGAYDEIIDFKKIDDDENIKYYNWEQGFRYHYWGLSTKYDQDTLLVQALFDSLTMILLPYMIFTIPAQYLFLSLEYGLKVIAYLYQLTFVAEYYNGNPYNGENY